MLAREFGMGHDALNAHLDRLVNVRFANRALADTVERVARQPLRKLGPNERLVGLLRRLEKHGLPPEPLLPTIAAALHYYDPADAECRRMRRMVSAGGPVRVLAETCKMDPGEPAFHRCLMLFDEIGSRWKGRRAT
jgi:mannitol-1-phosphate 5-dehydrogenase